MDLEVGFAGRGLLASDVANARARGKVSSDVVTVRTTSTSGISGTGLKKCSPTKRSPRFVAAAMAAMVRLEVLEAKIVAGPHSPARSPNNGFFGAPIPRPPPPPQPPRPGPP